MFFQELRTKRLVSLLMVASMYQSVVFAKDCRTNNFRFEKASQLFHYNLSQIRNASYDASLSFYFMALRAQHKGLQVGDQVFRETAGRLLGYGSYLGLTPPWYATSKPGVKEFMYDAHKSVSQIASESWGLLKKLNQYAVSRPWDTSFYFEKSITKKLLRGLQQSGYGLASWFGFLPVHMSFLQTPVARILNKLEKNPKYEPTREEVNTLKRFKQYESFLERKVFLSKPANRVYQRARYLASMMVRVALFVSLIAVLNHFLYMAEYEAVIPADEFLLSPKSIPDPGQIQLIVDMVPFPHLAIRIGNEIYSYGQTHLSKMIDSEYIKMRQLRQVTFDIGIEDAEKRQAEKEQSWIKRSSAAVSHQFIKTTGIDKLPLSLQVVTLNLGAEERQRVRNRLESNLGKRYINETAVNDCATMVMRDLGMENQLFDASPSQVLMWFAMQKRMGSDMVDSVKTVMVEDDQNPLKHMRRNALINMTESALFLNLFVVNQAHRIYVDQRYPQDQDLMYYSQKSQKALDGLVNDARLSLEADLQIQKFRQKLPRVLASNDANWKQDFKQEIQTYLTKIQFQNRSDAAGIENQKAEIDLYNQIVSQHRVHLIQEIKEELLSKL